MTKINLRPYQENGIAAICDFVSRNKGRSAFGIVSIPTGGGKSVVAMTAASRIGGRILWLSHRAELLEQAAETAQQVWPSATVSIVAGRTKDPINTSNLVIASTSTVGREGNNLLASSGLFSLVIVDECHHGDSKTFLSAILSAGKCPVIGLSATPKLGGIFNSITFEYSIGSAIRDGVLCEVARPVVCRVPDLKLDKVGLTAGDYNLRALNAELKATHYANHTANAVVKYCKDRKRILIFCASIEQAEVTENKLKSFGISSATITGATDSQDRREVLNSFKNGKGPKVILNIGVLTEGYDCPAIDCIVIARPTYSETLYTQMLGRGLRKSSEKKNLLIVDMTGATVRHGTPGIDNYVGTICKSVVDSLKSAGEYVAGSVSDLISKKFSWTN